MSGMQYVEIPYVDKKLSGILYGTADPPFLEGGDGNGLLNAEEWSFLRRLKNVLL